jgi:tetratricopeptide (TPR) repeat protein
MRRILQSAFFLLLVLAASGCKSAATSAQEYFSIGMAYFELGKYEEAERWLNRAKSADKTTTASQYNLGRLAFERQRFNEAAVYFEDILKKDQNNVLALKAAAYTRIKTGDIDIAEKHYSRLLEIIPESADDGYNHALVLYAMGRYGDAEKTLEKYLLPLLEKSDIQLLYARSQGAQNKIEAVESFSGWLNNNKDAKVRYEYAQVLEYHDFYARAIEEYRKAISETTAADKNLKNDIRFALARILMIADSESSEGINELQSAVNEGFSSIKAVEELLAIEKISAANKERIRNIVYNMQVAAMSAASAEEKQKNGN